MKLSIDRCVLSWLIPNFSNKFQKFEKEYMRELESKEISIKTQFEYAWCLIRSNYASDVHKVSDEPISIGKTPWFLLGKFTPIRPKNIPKFTIHNLKP
jgi:hypothetical protein